MCTPVRAGIVTSLLVSLLGQARIYVVLGREGLLPPSLAALHSRRATPVRATCVTGISAGASCSSSPPVASSRVLAERLGDGPLQCWQCSNPPLFSH